jgi:hypothetical protein
VKEIAFLDQTDNATKLNPENQKEQNPSEDGTYLLTPEQHRAWAKQLRQANKPQLALAHEQVAQAIERKSRTAVAKTPDAEAVHRVAEKLALSQQNAEKWAKIAAKPGLSPEAAAWAWNAARSFKAAVELGQKALAYQEQIDGVDTALPTSPSASTPVNSRPRLLLRAEQYRQMANQLRANPAPKAQELALHCENLAKIAEQRESAQPISQAGAFQRTAEQAEAQVAALRKNTSPQAQEQVAGDQALAPLIRSQGQAIEKQHASASALKAALPPFLEKGFRAFAEVAFFMLSVFVVLGFLHLIVTADPVWFLAALAFGGLIWFGKSRS